MIPNKITIHCSATINNQECDISEIRKWHKARGFVDVGYHGVIQPSGEFQKGRGLNIKGAHVKGHNEGNIGICLIGTDKFTSKQFATLRYHLDAMYMLYPIEDYGLFTHAQFDSAIKQGKTCPNIPINNLFAWYFLNDSSAMSDYLIQSN